MSEEKYYLTLAAIWGTVIILCTLAIAVPVTVYKIETEKYAIEHGYVQNQVTGVWGKEAK